MFSGFAEAIWRLIKILCVVTAATTGIVLGTTALFNSSLISAGAGAIAGLLIGYLSYETHRTCLALAVATGICGGISPWLISVFGIETPTTIGGMLVNIGITSVSIFIAIIMTPYKGGQGSSRNR